MDFAKQFKGNEKQMRKDRLGELVQEMQLTALKRKKPLGMSEHFKTTLAKVLRQEKQKEA